MIRPHLTGFSLAENFFAPTLSPNGKIWCQFENTGAKKGASLLEEYLVVFREFQETYIINFRSFSLKNTFIFRMLGN